LENGESRFHGLKSIGITESEQAFDQGKKDAIGPDRFEQNLKDLTEAR
jgi:hypothetical protein